MNLLYIINKVSIAIILVLKPYNDENAIGKDHRPKYYVDKEVRFFTASGVVQYPVLIDLIPINPELIFYH